ncbi:MAG: PAS domain S-box protein [Thiobacillus sp.]|nr:PAS domain S-box protein [Thiobacillus sp.]
MLDTPSEERFDRLTRLAQHLLGTPIALVSLVDADRQWFKSRQGLDATETGRDISFCGHAILGGDIFEVTDASRDPRFADNPLVTGPPNIRFYAGAPLSTPEGYRIGTLCVIADAPRQLTAKERQGLLDIAACVEEEISQAALKSQSIALRQAQRLGEIIAHVQSTFICETDRHKAFKGLLTDILRLTGSRQAFLGEVLNTSHGEPYLASCVTTDGHGDAAAAGDAHATALLRMRFGVSPIQLDAILRSGEPVISDASVEDSGHGISPNTPREGGVLIVPVHHGDSLVAILGMANRPGGYDAVLIDFLQPLLSTLGQLVVAARIQQLHREDQKNLTRFKRTLDQTLDCVFMFDAASQRFFYVNEGGMRQVGYTLDEMLSMRPFDLKPDITEAQFQTLIAPLLAGEQDSLTFETRHQHKDGHTVPVEIFLQYIAPTDEPARFVAIVRDLSERQRIERMKSEFVSTVSHELRTPLTSISGALGLLVGGALGAFPEQAKRMIDIAYQNSQRLTFLINDLLDMEKLLAGRMDFDIQVHALAPLLAQAIQDIQSYASHRRIHVRLSGDIGAATVRVDAHRLQQVMANLLSNAAKFSPEDGIVRVEAEVGDTVLRVAVKDDGPGVPTEFRDRIFQKFSQADSSDSRNKGGTGLGLAITRELVERMGGTIGFESEEGAGACFFFELPAGSPQLSPRSVEPARGVTP